MNGNIFFPDGLSPTVTTNKGEGNKIDIPVGTMNKWKHQPERVVGWGGVSGTLESRDYKDPIRVALPVLTPDRENKRQNGRRFKENGEEMFTLTAQDIHGVAIDVWGELEERGYPGIYVELSEDCTVYAVWNDKYECYLAVRKLTAKECFRLQGFTDDYFEKAEFVNSNSQLYKQAGNGVTVNVVYEIARRMVDNEQHNTD